MTFDFYTVNSQFTIGENTVARNGEVIAEGNIFLFQLLFGFPAILMVSQNPSEKPKIIRTSQVKSVLPIYEFFDGQQQPLKQTFKIVFEKENKKNSFTVLAVDLAHALQLVRGLYDNPKVLSTTLIGKAEKSSNRGNAVC
ncbi:hypothetical protein NC797_07560 [Aquibacillus sp. 3ASR75-11]|uniref:Uncharacterized protein n=1 Tax=Terrihalobacillus insolitus TaxID=2950438 RepID=A0A9X3WQR7_9BACI|nr:hypothetical protein [Terrihalobacillus insolitus]MDC3424362.1 hypothetical protein [Terrihalobacillus insolitus]